MNSTNSKPKRKQIYAIYKGDEFKFVGSKEECAEHLNVAPFTIYFMSTPTYRKRRANSNNALLAIRLEDE
jgi:hypothetical protein